MPITAARAVSSSVRFDEAALQLGREISSLLMSFPETVRSSAYEIRIRCGQPVIITTAEGSYIPDKAHSISRAQMNEIFTNICGNAVYSRQTEIAEGCVALVGGHRAGVCGRAVRNGETTVSMTDISSVCIRIAHEVPGCADALVREFMRGSGGMLIAGPPCSGKTTLLRDMARSISQSRNVAIVDERNEIAAVHRGVPQLDIGCRSDVMTGQIKSAGMLHAVRCMSPDVLICDEIGSVDEAEAVRAAMCAGVTVIAAMHCGSAAELAQREQFRLLRDSGAFACAAILDRGKPGRLAQLTDIFAL